jgi:hypothetical protein
MYLAVYNSMLVFVWGALLYSLFKETMHAYFASSSSQAFWQRGLAPLHQHFVDFLIQVQCMTSMDVVHAALGLTPSGLLPNLLQNGTRLSAVIIAAKRTAGDKSPFVHLAFLAMAFAWSNADAIRYGYYTQDYLSGGRKIKGFLTRARYTAFLWLYPIGAFAEAYLFYVLRQQLVAQGSPWAPLVLALLVAYPLGMQTPNSIS